jgi:hypothetical protein
MRVIFALGNAASAGMGNAAAPIAPAAAMMNCRLSTPPSRNPCYRQGDAPKGARAQTGGVPATRAVLNR